MKKIVKIAAIVVAVILAVALIAPFALRGKIAEIVKREANAMLDARLDFEKLDISLLRHFPRASLDLKGLTLVGEEPFAGDTIVAAQRISVVVNVMSLFGDEGFEVTKIILSEPALHAHKLADGRVNWDVVKASEEAQGEEEPPADAEPSSFRLSVRDFRISDAAIRYEDDSTGMRFSTAPLSLRLRGDMSADQTDLDLRLTAKGGSDDDCQERMAPLFRDVRSRLGDYLYGVDVSSLEEVVLTRLRQQGLTLSAAESCTGGLIAKRITDVPGASGVFMGGVVSYTNIVKHRVLGVPADMLEEYGAVSAPVARAMAEGARKATTADCAVSVTGVAGPDRDERGNPVGTVFIGFSSPKETIAERFDFGAASREEIRGEAADEAFKLLEEKLKEA